LDVDFGTTADPNPWLVKAWIDQGAEWPDDLSGDTPPSPPDPKAARIMQALRDGDKQTFRQLASEDPKVGNRKGIGGATPDASSAVWRFRIRQISAGKRWGHVGR